MEWRKGNTRYHRFLSYRIFRAVPWPDARAKKVRSSLNNFRADFPLLYSAFFSTRRVTDQKVIMSQLLGYALHQSSMQAISLAGFDGFFP